MPALRPYDGAMTEPARTPPARTDPAAAPLDEAVARVGDRWTLLLVQALLDGPRRFNELLEALPGIAPNVLSQRLKHLERETVVVGQPYSRRPPRVAYELTASGRELAGALRLLAQWGADRSGSPDPEGLRHLACGTPLEARWYCPTCARPVDDDDAGDLRFV
jgi:DNA-binding HxlR family transcriptional regulator